jgi:hypothetical protein
MASDSSHKLPVYAQAVSVSLEFLPFSHPTCWGSSTKPNWQVKLGSGAYASGRPYPSSKTRGFRGKWTHLEACDDSLGVLLPRQIGRSSIRGGGPRTASRDTTTGPHSIPDRLKGFVLLFLLLVSLPSPYTIPDGFLDKRR